MMVFLRTVRYLFRKAFYDSAENHYFRHRGQREAVVAATISIDIGKLNLSHLAQVAGLHAAAAGSKKYGLLKSRFEKGNDCFGAFHRGELIAVVWGLYHEDYYRVHDLYVRPVEGELVLSDGLTVPRFRGRRVLPYLLGMQLNIYCDRGMRAIMAIERDNISSQHACLHYGFDEYDVVRKLRILGIRIK
jgi:hypothetical protein